MKVELRQIGRFAVSAAIVAIFSTMHWHRVYGAELLFAPYDCQTAIERIAFNGPAAVLAKSESGARFSLTRGPAGLVIDETTGAPQWSSPVQGRYVVRVKAIAGRVSDEVEWILRVVPKEADDVIVYSTKHLDFVLTKRQLEGDAFLERKSYLDGMWECYARLVGQEPVSDRQVLAWDPKVSGALAGNPIRMGGTGDARKMGWTDSVWQRHGVDHELAHNFNNLIRTPGKWSSEKYAEGFGKPWLDMYMHHLCGDAGLVLAYTALREPRLFQMSGAELKSYQSFVANNVYLRMAADRAKKQKEQVGQGKTMQELATLDNGTWGHVTHTVVKRFGVDVLEDWFRAMRYDGLPDAIFEGATTPERKLTLCICLLSASARRDLRPLFAEFGFLVEEDYYNKLHSEVETEMKKLPAKEEWFKGWTKSPVNGRYYRVMRWTTDWPQAERMARQWGGRLPEIQSPGEQEWLARRFSHLGPVWLGLRDPNGKDEWQWVSGERLTAPYWNPKDQKDARNRCAALDKAEPVGSWRRLKPETECVVIVERLVAGDLDFPSAPTADDRSPDRILTAQDARTRIGQSVTVELMVKNTAASGSVIFLNSEENFRSPSNLGIVLLKDYQVHKAAPADPIKFFAGKKVRVKGVVSLTRDLPRIAVVDPNQIDVVD